MELQGKLEAEQARASALEAAVASATARSRDLEVQLVHTSTGAQEALQQQQAALQAALERQVAQVTEVRRIKDIVIHNTPLQFCALSLQDTLSVV